MRDSSKVYRNQKYRDGKQRIVILTKGNSIISCNRPYGWSKDNEYKKI